MTDRLGTMGTESAGRMLRLTRRPRRYAFGAFTLDADRQVLLRGSEQIRLGSRAMAILTELAKGGGALVGKEALVRAVWPDTFVEEVNLRVHISALRRAMGEPPGEPSMIANVAGRGYRLTVDVAELLSGSDIVIAAAAPREMPDVAVGLVGLEPSVEAVLQRLREGRLVAIAGPEGVGKTALAIEAGLRFCETGAELRVFDVVGAAPADLARTLQALERVGRDRLLTVIDGLSDPAGTVGKRMQELVRRNPGLRILTTGDTPGGAATVMLGGLSLAAADAIAPPAEALFEARAAARGLVLEQTPRSREDLALICRHTGGRPLAIRIAAAAAAALGPRRLARRLDEAVAGGADQEQVLHAMAEWLIDTLSPEDAVVLRRLSVFCTSFTLDAAVAIAADERFPTDAVVASLGNLIDCSLVESSALKAPRRFRLRPGIRRLAEAEALLAGETAGLRSRLSQWLVARLDAAARDNRGRPAWRESVTPLLAEAGATLDILATTASPAVYAELARAALPAGVEDRQGTALLAHAVQALSQISSAPAPDRRASAALSLQIALSDLERHGPSPAADRLLERVCRECGRAPELRAEAFFGMARAALGRGEFELAREYAEMSAEMRRREPAPELPLTDGLRAEIEHGSGNHVVARDLAIEVLRDAALARTAGPERGALMVQMRVIAARSLWLTGRADSARRALADALEHAVVEGPLPLCRTLVGAACPIAFWCGSDEEAAAHAARLAEIARRAELPYWQGWAEVYAAVVNILAAREGRANRRAELPAMTTLQQQTMATLPGLPMSRRADQPGVLAVGWCLPELMRLEGVRRLATAESGAPEEAEPYFLRALDLARRQGALAWELRAATSLAQLAPALARPDAAVPLARVYAKFTEGHDTADLVVARGLLRGPDTKRE